ncbi:MAG: hypothetical protein HUJ97_09385, partial [Bacteroidales bacterium]|nr:hypothetical protein [Bacteroidales bacterium]
MIDYFDKEKIEQCFPEATMIPPMLVFSIPKHKKNILKEICDNGKYFLQLKKDGYCFTFNKTENHSYLFSRNVSKGNGLLCEKIGCVPHIEKALSNLPTNTVLVGEIYYPNGTSKDTTTIMGCLPKTAIDRQKTRGLIHYYIHDIIMFNGKNIMDKGAEKRYEILKILFESFKLYEYDFLELAAAHTENLYDKVGEALARGEEGVVLKLKTGTYEPTKRPAWNQIKVKKQDSADVICLGFEDPTKYYTGKEIEMES